MTFREWIDRNGSLVFMLILILALTVFAGSFIFTAPDHLTGTVIEKIYVPSRVKVGDTPYGGMKRGQYSVQAVQEEQWIAVVRTDEGDTLQVHCEPAHYGVKNVGDRIKFLEYQGSLVHIDYFAHGEEEGDR